MKKLFRKIHLWLSVPFGIVITLICFSGAMLVFEKEITEMCRGDLYFVKEVKEKPLPLDSLMKAVASTLPDSVAVTNVTISPDAARAYQVGLSKPRRASLYVDQYTGEVKGRGERLPFYDTMFHLHRWLMGDSRGFGKLLVGTSTLMLVIILITGILMWLTNRHKPLKKSLGISFTKGWPRFWHDLHVAGGIYVTVFLLALALTGLTWSFSWYRTGFYGMFGVEAGEGHGAGNRDAGKERPGRPEGKRHAHGAKHGRHEHGRHHDSVPATDSHREYREVASTPEVQPAEQVEQPAVAAAPPAEERHEAEHRGRHGRGGRGRHRHEGDTTGLYAHHYHADSLRARDDRPETGEGRRRSAGADSLQSAGAGSRRVNDRKNRRDANVQGRHADKRKPVRTNVRPDMKELSSPGSSAVEKPFSSPFARWQEVYDELAKAHPGYRQITLSDGTASVVPAGHNSLRSGDRFDFDSESGKILSRKPYSEQDKSSKVRSAVYTVHVGSWGGMLTRILTFLAALLGATLPLTGYYLWIRRIVRKSAHKHPKTEI